MLGRFFLESGLSGPSTIDSGIDANRNHLRGFTVPLEAPSATEKNEVVIVMSFPRLPKIATVAGCLAACLPAAVAQNSITLLSDSPIQPAPSTAGPNSAYTFQSTIQELYCPATGIYANISSAPSTLDTGNLRLLVLDSISVTVTPAGGSATGPVNICPTQFTPPGPVCFNSTTVHSEGDLDAWVGYDPDNNVPGLTPAQTFYQHYGVSPISIADKLSPGLQSVTIELENTLSPTNGSMGN